MKYLLVLFLLVSCRNRSEKITVFMMNGSGLEYTSSSIQVDSVTETTPKSATIWIDGKKTVVYADRIMFAN